MLSSTRSLFNQQGRGVCPDEYRRRQRWECAASCAQFLFIPPLRGDEHDARCTAAVQYTDYVTPAHGRVYRALRRIGVTLHNLLWVNERPLAPDTVHGITGN